MRGLWTMALGALALPCWHGLGVLERFVGPAPSTKATHMDDLTPDEITQPLVLRKIDDVLERNYDRAPVRLEHAMHSGVLNAIAAAAAEASSLNRTELSAWYRELGRHVDEQCETRLRATAARAA